MFRSYNVNLWDARNNPGNYVVTIIATLIVWRVRVHGCQQNSWVWQNKVGMRFMITTSHTHYYPFKIFYTCTSFQIKTILSKRIFHSTICIHQRSLSPLFTVKFYSNFMLTLTQPLVKKHYLCTHCVPILSLPILK